MRSPQIVSAAAYTFVALVVNAAPANAAPTPSGTSLEQTLVLLYTGSPAFQTYEAQTRQAVALHLRAQGAFDLNLGAGINGTRALWPGQFGAYTDQGYQDLSAHASLVLVTPQNISAQLFGSTPIASSVDAAASPDQPQVTANLTIPLTKLGRSAASGALERAARLHADGAAALQQDAESELVATVAEAYWRWVGSYEALKLARTLEALAGDQLRDVDQLIEHNARAQADSLPIKAALDNAVAIRVKAEQVAFDAQQSLFETLGIPSPADHASPTEALPDVSDSLPTSASLRSRGHEASRRRHILVYLERELAAAAARAEGARIAKRPDVNILLQGTAARVESAQAPTQTLPDYYGVAGLQFAFPLGNRAARGAYDYAASAYDELHLAATERHNVIDARIDALSDALVSAARAYAKRKEAVEQYQAAYDAERARFRAGNATALDVVIAEQQYIGASVAAVSDRTEYAVAMGRFLHETGLLSHSVQQRDAGSTARRLTSSTF